MRSSPYAHEADLGILPTVAAQDHQKVSYCVACGLLLETTIQNTVFSGYIWEVKPISPQYYPMTLRL